jgi:hypothetical protein
MDNPEKLTKGTVHKTKKNKAKTVILYIPRYWGSNVTAWVSTMYWNTKHTWVSTMYWNTKHTWVSTMYWNIYIYIYINIVEASGFRLPKWTDIWWEAPMKGSVLNFLKAEWKVFFFGETQVSYHLAKWLQRKSCFRNWPIRTKTCLWQPYLLIDRDEMSNL